MNVKKAAYFCERQRHREEAIIRFAAQKKLFAPKVVSECQKIEVGSESTTE